MANPAQVERLIALKHKYVESLRALPNVNGIDVGYKYVNGENTGDVAIRIMVDKKVPMADDNPAKMPKQIEGALTDVIEAGPATPLISTPETQASALPAQPNPKSRFATLQGGISAGPARASIAGTLGGIVYDRNYQLMALSNYHVFCMDANWKVGDQMVQQAVLDGGNTQSDLLGLLQNGKNPSAAGGNNAKVDAAICTLDNSRDSSNLILGFGPVGPVVAASLGMTVSKSGRTTGVTTGKVDSIVASKKSTGGYWLEDQIRITSVPTGSFCDHGDSGSLVLCRPNVVGLLWGSDNFSAYACKIQNVLAALDVQLFGSQYPVGTIYLSSVQFSNFQYGRQSGRLQLLAGQQTVQPSQGISMPSDGSGFIYICDAFGNYLDSTLAFSTNDKTSRGDLLWNLISIPNNQCALQNKSTNQTLGMYDTGQLTMNADANSQLFQINELPQYS